MPKEEKEKTNIKKRKEREKGPGKQKSYQKIGIKIREKITKKARKWGGAGGDILGKLF